MRTLPKQKVASTLVSIGCLGVVLSYWGIWTMLTTFAAGLVWWVEAALFLSGPVACVGAAIAWRQPRQKVAIRFGLTAGTLWLLLWVLMFALLGFTYEP